MPIFDVSQVLQESTPVFPGDPPFSMSRLFSRENHDEFNLSLLSMTTHTGTHVDAPAHYLDGGGTVDTLPPEILVGPGIILNMTGAKVIDRAILENSAWSEETRLFFRTDCSAELREKS